MEESIVLFWTCEDIQEEMPDRHPESRAEGEVVTTDIKYGEALAFKGVEMNATRRGI